jgi:N utilization substance protein A
MPPAEQSPFERYRPGQQLKFFVVQVGRTIRGPEIVVSRTHPDLLRRLFEVEVPEIFSGVIEIKAIAREPGARSKVAVTSNQEGVDAVGACVGLRGIRIQNVVNELLGEKIDVIEWDEDPVKFISNSLSPAVADRVILNVEGESATVLVPDRQLSLAIGREGQNARLAAKLTNWRIDIQGTSQIVEETPAIPEPEVVVEAATDAVAETNAAAVPAAEPEVSVAAAEVAEAAPVAEVKSEVAAEPVIDDGAAKAAADAELAALEEELAVLEREEEERKAAKESEVLDVSSDDLWQVDGGSKAAPAKEVGGIRFAEDIAGFRETDAGRRGGRRGGSSARNRRRR